MFPVGLHLHFPVQMQILANPPASQVLCTGIQIMEVASRPPKHVHDVAGDSAIYYPHLEDA
jgi:hypothetical protein